MRASPRGSASPVSGLERDSPTPAHALARPQFPLRCSERDGVSVSWISPKRRCARSPALCLSVRAIPSPGLVGGAGMGAVASELGKDPLDLRGGPVGSVRPRVWSPPTPRSPPLSPLGFLPSFLASCHGPCASAPSPSRDSFPDLHFARPVPLRIPAASVVLGPSAENTWLSPGPPAPILGA